MSSFLSTTSDDQIHITNGGGVGTTVVAIDKDKSSPYAVRWAIDNILPSNSTIFLLHVSNRYLQNHSINLNEAALVANVDPESEGSPQVFVPYRVYCTRKQVTVKEIVLDEVDVSKAILNYISTYFISNIVVGASIRSSLTKKLKNHDVPTILNKYAPDFCSVYVIAKGKAQSVRPAIRPAVNSVAPPRQSLQRAITPRLISDLAETEEKIVPVSFKRGNERVKSKISPSISSLNIDEILLESNNFNSHNAFGDESGSVTPQKNGPFGSTSKKIDSQTILEPTKDITSPASTDLEAAMKRLKLDLKQTMDMYNTACQEATYAKKKAEELHMWKMEETKRFEQARLTEDVAYAIIEKEKAKTKAAMEAAEKANKLAELEARKRIYAEKKAKRENEEKKRALEVLSNNDVRYRKFTIEEIEAATEKFSSSLKVGEGGYGPVYKAKLDHTPVAIKVLRPNAKQGRKQFQQEVEILSCMRHPNMVLLLGACPDYGCLVYEYMNYGSLEDRLFRKGNTPSLPWKIRFKIASDIATGLLFLHQAKPEPLVHRDLKPANILLDLNFVCKISDVGLARLVPPSVADSVTQYHMTSAAGTFCYIDPEYQQTGKLGTKSDIYSLGIMLLQVITARPPMGLSHHVERAIQKGNFVDLLDPAVPDWPVQEALAFAKLALMCCELRKRDRPDLGAVILPELNRITEFGKRNEINVQLSPITVSPRNSSGGNQRGPLDSSSTSSCFSLKSDNQETKE